MDGSLFRKIKEYLMDIMNIGGVIMATITKETIVGDILDIAPETAPAFLNIGMHCLGCPASRNETVEQACMVHGVDTNELLEQLNQVIATNKK
ncbi:MAG: hypothetical protein K0S60_422 [Evtepia sp.]|nr:hypothetical protein [Evtepia sp.]